MQGNQWSVDHKMLAKFRNWLAETLSKYFNLNPFFSNEKGYRSPLSYFDKSVQMPAEGSLRAVGSPWCLFLDCPPLSLLVLERSWGGEFVTTGLMYTPAVNLTARRIRPTVAKLRSLLSLGAAFWIHLANSYQKAMFRQQYQLYWDILSERSKTLCQSRSKPELVFV